MNVVTPPDPVVRRHADVERFWCLPVALEHGRIVAWVDYVVLEGMRDRRVIEAYWPGAKARANAPWATDPAAHRASDRVPIDLGSSRSVAARSLVRLEPGRWELVGASPLEGEAKVQLIAMRARVAAR